MALAAAAAVAVAAVAAVATAAAVDLLYRPASKHADQTAEVGEGTGRLPPVGGPRTKGKWFAARRSDHTVCVYVVCACV